MKTTFLLTTLAVLMYVSVAAQISIATQAIAGGSDNDYLIKMCKSKYGGLLAAGYSESNHSSYKTEDSRGSYDYWVVKYSRNGEKLWDKTIGGDTSDVLVDAISTYDGGFLLGGNSWSGKSGEKTRNSHGSVDYWLVKLNGRGNIQWDKTIGSIDYDGLSDLDRTNDSGFILAGSLGLTKIDSRGNVQWQKKLSYLDYPSTVRQTRDGGYILTGTFDPGNGFSFYMVKADSMLNKQWSYDFGWSYSQTTRYDTKQTNDGGFIAYGYGATSRSESGDYYYDYFINIVKTDNKGNVEWHTDSGNDPLYSATPSSISGNCLLQPTDDKGFIFGATAGSLLGSSPPEARAFYILKLSSNGNVQWYKYISGNNYDVLNDIKKISPNHYVLGGYSASPISGDKTRRNLGGADYWLVAVTDTSSAITINNIAAASATKKETKEIFVYPNPAKDILHIQTNGKATLTLTDQSGKIFLTKIINGKGEINIANFTAGLFYLKNKTTGEVKKVIVSK